MANTHEQHKEQQRLQWGASAPAWEDQAEFVVRTLDGLAERLLDLAGVASGKRVLDIACGAGEPSIGAARRGAAVTATDLAPAMVEATRRRASQAGVSLEARVADAEALDFPDGSFDALTCRFGLMFCPQPERAAAEMRRVLRPGGRFAIAVWDVPEHNPFFTVIGGVMQKFAPAPPPDPAAPGVFRLAPPGELERVMRAGGFADVSIEPISLTFDYDSPEHYWTVQSDLAAPLKAAVQKLPPDDVARLRDAVIEAGRLAMSDGVVRFAARALVATGAR